ncbi:MAG: hypothetical protein WD872_21970 [Pirellulaceae bacterium]
MILGQVVLDAILLGEIVLGARAWLPWAIGLALAALVVLVWAYARRGPGGWLRGAAALLKTVAILALAVCLVEPLFTGTRPRPGSNVMLVVADNSQSLGIADRGARRSRGQQLQARLAGEQGWLARLGQDFDLRRYTFDMTLRPVKSFADLPLDGQASALTGSLASLAERFRGQPVAGILLFTDGNATDLGDSPATWQDLPPIYPVVLGAEQGLVDLSVTRVSVSQTNFDAAPVTITSEVVGQSLAGRKIVVRVLDQAGKEVERRTAAAPPDDEPLAQRFLLKPEQAGISFYTVHACLEGEEEGVVGSRSAEATLANNRRLATVDRGGGPYRVLYVSGRPNWEFKFLRRALERDDEVTLVGLVRIAKKEPKFAFLGRRGEQTNPLFRGFGNNADEEAEQYDQPVLLRLGTEDKDELRGGFPTAAEDLYRYHAIVLDDVEAAFFTQDQQSLVQQFVSHRGGGLLMLGGKESFADGGYDRTAIGELLPVYLDRTSAPPTPGGWRLQLTREGWLQPWVRVRTTQPEEERRLAAMPGFKTLSRIDAIKPGASVLASVESADGTVRPALAVQPFGRGRSAALLVGDLWRWDLQRPDPAESDLEKSWRQTARWLVADVPQPVEVEIRRQAGMGQSGVELVVRARDKLFEPLDNAAVAIQVQTPDERTIELSAQSSGRIAGEYIAPFVPREAGAYRASVVVTAADGSEAGRRDAGWAVEPQTEEFRTLTANRPLLDRIAQETGGEVLSLDGLDRFVAGLPNRKIPITESWTYPLWHQWSVLALVIACLVGEWGLRRWKGLP